MPQAEIELQDPAAARPSPVDDGDDVLLKPSSSGARDRRGAPLFDDDDRDYTKFQSKRMLADVKRRRE